MNVIKNSCKLFFSKGSERTIAAKKNIVASFLLRLLGIAISLQVIPLTINYINPSQYGIWLTLSSIITWIAYFDFGMAHGFKNRFAEAKAKKDYALVKKYVSTTYAVLVIIFSFLFFVIAIINYNLNWSSILNVDELINSELQKVFFVLCCFFCLNVVANVFTTMVDADQKTALAALIQTGGQLIAFVLIYILTKNAHGSLLLLAFVFSGVPCVFLIITSFLLFKSKGYSKYSPAIKFVDFKLTKNILGLGGQFFLIMISILFIFQFINIIISRMEGAEAVTQYNIAYKYFNIVNMVVVIILTPFWSAFTDAYTKGDLEWMKKAKKRLEQMWAFCIPIIFLMLICSDFIFNWWIGDSVVIPFNLSLCIAVYVLFQTYANLYMYLINGTGKVRVQLIVYLFFSFISIPLMIIGCKKIGICGVFIAPILVYLVQAIVGRIQINRLIANRATGIWNK